MGSLAAIYSFRAATVRNILDFPGQFSPSAEIVTLDQNYRSTQPILAAANAVIDLAEVSFIYAPRAGGAYDSHHRTAVLGSAAAWPLAARAQRPDRVRLIGVLVGNEQSEVTQSWLAAFLGALSKLGLKAAISGSSPLSASKPGAIAQF